MQPGSSATTKVISIIITTHFTVRVKRLTKIVESTTLSPTVCLTVKSEFNAPLPLDVSFPVFPIGTVHDPCEFVYVPARAYASISSSVCACANVPYSATIQFDQAGAAMKRRADLTASRMLKMSNSVERRLGERIGWVKAEVLFRVMLPREVMETMLVNMVKKLPFAGSGSVNDRKLSYGNAQHPYELAG